MSSTLRLRASIGAMLMLYPGASFAADPNPKVAPRPAWVEDVAIPAPDAARKDEPGQFLLLAFQTRMSKNAQETYFEYALVPQTVGGLQGTGTIALPWNVAQADLTIHAIELRRGSQVIDLLKNAEFTILRRENNLEHASLDGVRTVVLPAKGLQVGDVLHVAATYTIKPDKIGTHLDYRAQWKPPTKIGRLRVRVLVDSDVKAKWRSAPLAEKPKITTRAGETEYLFEKSSAEEIKFANAMLPVDKQVDIEFSRFGSWGEIAGSFQPLFDSARKIAPDSPLAKEADKIAAQSQDPVVRMMAALRLAQEQVRYVALLLGDGAYVPTPAEENWERKFADCKGKTALLLALLDRLGIEATPLLVKSDGGQALPEHLPSVGIFDHVIVRATLAGKHYYLDPTNYGQRTASEVSGSAFGYGLPVVAGAALENLRPVPVEQPSKESSITWDASAGIAGDVPYTARVRLRSSLAAMARARRAMAEDKDKLETQLKNYLPGLSNDAIELADWTETDEAGDFVINYRGKTSLGWDRYEGMKGYRIVFSNDALKWEPDFDRKEGPFKDKDVLIGAGYWEKQVETFLLPNGGRGFKIEPRPLNEQVAGSRLSRTVTLDGNKAVAVGEFKHVAWSISAEEARKGMERLKDLNEDYAYLVAPSNFHPPKEKD